jgi:hypothetical protein
LLLSSVFIYNTMALIEEASLRHLSFVTALAAHINPESEEHGEREREAVIVGSSNQKMPTLLLFFSIDCVSAVAVVGERLSVLERSRCQVQQQCEQVHGERTVALGGCWRCSVKR